MLGKCADFRQRGFGNDPTPSNIFICLLSNTKSWDVVSTVTALKCFDGVETMSSGPFVHTNMATRLVKTVGVYLHFAVDF